MATALDGSQPVVLPEYAAVTAPSIVVGQHTTFALATTLHCPFIVLRRHFLWPCQSQDTEAVAKWGKEAQLLKQKQLMLPRFCCKAPKHPA